MGSFFYWLYAVGYKLLHRKPKENLRGMKTRNFGIFIWNTLFSNENCGRLPVEYPEIGFAGTCRIDRSP
jgi:hypothetical protein